MRIPARFWSSLLPLLSPGLLFAQAGAPPVPEPVLVCHNPAGEAQETWVCASLPLPRGRYLQVPGLRVGGRRAEGVELMRWPDGSLALLQLQWRPRLGPRSWSEHRVEFGMVEAGPPALAKAARWVLQGDLPLQTEVEDPWGRVYRARLDPDPTAGEGGYLRRSAVSRLRQYRGVHRRGAHAMFGMLAWLETFADSRRAVLTLALDNAAYGVGAAAGPLRFRRFSLRVTEPRLRTRPRDWQAQGIALPVSEKDQGSRIDLLPRSAALYLGDRTAKCFRIDLFLDGPQVGELERRAADLAVRQPVLALPGLNWTRHTGAFSAHGGPGPGTQRPTAHAAWIATQLRKHSDQGPFGSYGRGKDPAAQGTPHNGPMVLHNALRLASPALLRQAERMVLQHSLHPTPGFRTRLPKATASLRQGMSRRIHDVPHGFHRMDYEHFAVGMLFDHYWLTGDPVARRELQRMGEGLERLFPELPFLTCRGEGWCLQAGVLIARATGDPGLVQRLDTRFWKQVAPRIGPEGSSHVLPQPGHRDAFGEEEPFDAPWQMAALVHGLHAMWVQTGKAEYAALGRRAARVMAGPGWLEGTGPKYLVHAHRPGRYRMSQGHGPLEGTAWMQVGAFVLAEEMAQLEEERRTFSKRAGEICAPLLFDRAPLVRGNAWMQLYLDRRSR